MLVLYVVLLINELKYFTWREQDILLSNKVQASWKFLLKVDAYT